MRKIFVLFTILYTLNSVSQHTFVFRENGLFPKLSEVKIPHKTKQELYEKTILWVNQTFKKSKKPLLNNTTNTSITIIGFQENSIKKGKQYYHLKYQITILFKDGGYTFVPEKLFTKINSKYDMGWQAFELFDGTAYFKNGKVVKKTKSYVVNIPKVFSSLNLELIQFLKKE